MSSSVGGPAPESSHSLDSNDLRAWRATFEATQRLCDIIERNLRAAEGFGLSDFEVLVKLSEAPFNRLRMSELSRQVTQSPSRLSQRIDRMVRNGLVTRERVADDRRGFFAVLTPSGLASVRKAAPGHAQVVRQIFVNRLKPDEIELVGEVFGRLTIELADESLD